MKVGIIGAMEQEVAPISLKMNQQRTVLKYGFATQTGILQGIEVALVLSGIGKTASAMAAMMLIVEHKPDIIVNIGLAGSLSSSLNINDIVISEATCFHDVDLTPFGKRLGQVSGYPTKFTADQYLTRKAELCANELHISAIRGLVVSGDSFINSLEQLNYIRKNFPEAIAVEMEGASIGQVCYKAKLPFLVIRAISDSADQQSHIQFRDSIIFSINKLSLVFEHFLGSIFKDIR